MNTVASPSKGTILLRHTTTSPGNPYCTGECPSYAPVPAGVLLVDHHGNSRAPGSKPTLFLRENAFAFAVATEAIRDDFEEYFADVLHEPRGRCRHSPRRPHSLRSFLWCSA